MEVGAYFRPNSRFFFRWPLSSVFNADWQLTRPDGSSELPTSLERERSPYFLQDPLLQSQLSSALSAAAAISVAFVRTGRKWLLIFAKSQRLSLFSKVPEDNRRIRYLKKGSPPPTWRMTMDVVTAVPILVRGPMWLAPWLRLRNLRL